MAKNVHSEFIQTYLVQKDFKKFGMAKIGMVCNGLESNEICTFLGV